MPPFQSTVLQSLTNGPLVLKTLCEGLGDKNVRDVHIDLTFGGLLAHCIVSMAPRDERHAKKIDRLVANMTPLKRVAVVDGDVDIRDPLMWNGR